MEEQLHLITTRTSRIIKSRPKVLLIPFLVAIPLFYYLFAITAKTYSYEDSSEEKVINVYEDGVWYQTIGKASDEGKRTFSEKKIGITVDGEVKEILTEAIDLNVAIKEAEISVGEYDKVEPDFYAPVYDGMLAKIIRVTKAYEEVEDVINANIEYVENPEELLGKEKVIQEGINGKRLKVYEKEFEDGVLVSSELIENRVTQEPVNKIIEKGTKVVVLDTQYGVASYYFHPKYPNQLITAHNTYPMGSKLRVTNIKNGKSVVVTVVDRGIKSSDRVVDLSTTAFKQIAETWQGLAQVKVELLQN